MTEDVRAHYEKYPYPQYPLAASIRRCDTYALNLDALWAKLNGLLPPVAARRILLAGCGCFSPYPFSVANPHIPITAVDLSRRNTQRARLHCIFHGRCNVSFVVGDFRDPQVISGRFGLIDAYGVLHHLDDPQAGLTALAEKLADGGIVRVMLYNRITRRLEESLRRALRIVKIREAKDLKRLIAKAKPGTRLYNFLQHSYDAKSMSGLADALLHPCVHTFSVDDCLDLIAAAGLKPLLFAHADALQDADAEIARLRFLESKGEAPGNFVVYLGRNVNNFSEDKAGSLLMLNPCLKRSVGHFHFGMLRVLSRLGHPNPALGSSERCFLRRFIRPVAWDSLSEADQAHTGEYLQSLFLLRYHAQTGLLSGFPVSFLQEESVGSFEFEILSGQVVGLQTELDGLFVGALIIFGLTHCMPIPSVSRLEPQCAIEQQFRSPVLPFLHGAFGISIEAMGRALSGVHRWCGYLLLLFGSWSRIPFMLVSGRLTRIIDTMRSATVEGKKRKRQQ